MKENGRILDLGAGSGRDSRYFLERGFEVTSVDGSRELCRLASSYIGHEVLCCDFFSFVPTCCFDGIWAQASLVHLTKDEIQEMLRRMASWLEEDGTIALSFRYGDYVGEKDDRFYTYMTEASFEKLLEGTGLMVVSSWRSEDVRPGFRNQWLNLLLSFSR